MEETVLHCSILKISFRIATLAKPSVHL